MAGKITQAAEVDLTIKGAEKPKSLKQELREATQEAVKLSRQYGAFSDQALEAQQRLANIRDEMEDFNHRVNALNPDKFSRIGTAATGIANGFTAAQGAASLFGAESDNVQKALVRVQGAMALSQGLQGLNDSRQQLGALANMVKGPVIKAFTTLRGALMATGIGALVVAIGLLITNFDSVSKWVGKLKNIIPGLSTVINALSDAWEWVTEKVGEFTDAVGLTDRALSAHIDQLQNATDAAKKQAEIDEALGKDTYAQRKKILEDELELLKLNEEEQSKIADKMHEIRLLDAKRTKEIADKTSQEAEKQREKEKAAAEKAAAEWRQRSDSALQAQKSLSQELNLINMSDRERQLAELAIWRDEQARVLTAGGVKQTQLNELYRQKELKMRAEWAEQDKKAAEDEAKRKLDIQKKYLEDRIALEAAEFDLQQQNTATLYDREKLDLQRQLQDKQITRDEYNQRLIDNEVSRLERTIQDARDYGKSTLDLEMQLSELKLNQAQQTADKEREIATKDIELRKQLLTSALDTAQSIGQLLTNEESKRSRLNKAFALTQIAIDTAQAISALVRNSEANPANAVTGGLAGLAQFAAGFARIAANVAKAKEILKSGSTSSGGGGGSAPTNGGGGTPPPQFQQIGQDINIQKLGGGGSSGGTGGTVKIPVVEFNDIRNVQRRVEVLEEASEL